MQVNKEVYQRCTYPLQVNRKVTQTRHCVWCHECVVLCVKLVHRKEETDEAHKEAGRVKVRLDFLR